MSVRGYNNYKMCTRIVARYIFLTQNHFDIRSCYLLDKPQRFGNLLLNDLKLISRIEIFCRMHEKIRSAVNFVK